MWYRMLEHVRRLASRGDVTSAALATKARIPPAVASAWLGKLCSWGYVRRVARRAHGKGRPRTVYELTRWGTRFRPDGTDSTRQ